MSLRTSLVVACTGILIGLGVFAGTWAYVRVSQERTADDRAVAAPSVRVERNEEAPSLTEPNPIAQALSLAKVASTGVQMVIPVKMRGYFILANSSSEAGENVVRELYVDLDTRTVLPVAERSVGPAPQYTYVPYDMFSDQLHVKTVDAWEGLSITHDDYVDVNKGSVLARVDVYANHATAVVSDAHASTTIEYVYDKTQCMTQKHDGKKVTVMGVRVNGTRLIPFASPIQATCSFSEFSGDADLAIGFSSEGYRVNPEGMSIRVGATHSVVVPLRAIGDASAVVLDP